ncbi:uncharacterized protein LOC144656569 [Oculina patagonica]
MGSSTSCNDVPPPDNQASKSDGYEDEEPPTDDETSASPGHDDCEDRVSLKHNELADNIPEIADLLLPIHNPLEHVNWEHLRKEDQKRFKETQNNENENGNPQTTNNKVKAPTSAMSRS